jgi:hypothetical protein
MERCGRSWKTAHGLRDFVFGGPAWLNSDRYDIAGKGGSVSAKDENTGVRLKLRTLLQEGGNPMAKALGYGLTDTYDFRVEWTPDEGPCPGASGDAPSIFTALQEKLGLRLESTKGPQGRAVCGFGGKTWRELTGNGGSRPQFHYEKRHIVVLFG